MLKWRQTQNSLPEGVVVASDVNQEWLLSWWWDNYTRYNSYPVTFVDFGLSEEAKQWCRQKGELVESFFSAFPITKNQVDEEKARFWETVYESKSWWNKRVFWHQKPIAMLQSPYERSVWLDVDCEVKASLTNLFAQIQEPLLLCPELEEIQAFDLHHGNLQDGEVLFNSGVVGFMKDSPYILQWAEAALVKHSEYFGDQNLLSRLIHENNWPVHKLSRFYNWREVSFGKNPDVKIVHWVGEPGKFFISQKILGFL